jgi:IS5 family transposase
MKIKILEQMKLKFEQADWASDQELATIDEILKMNPYLIEMVAADIREGNKNSEYGRGDSPSVEQILRLAIYKELKKHNYRELAYAQKDSRICEQFTKVSRERAYSFQTLQKYISRIKEGTLSRLMVEINKIAIREEIEDLRKFREDSTVVETNIHYPTNNEIMYDCIKESHRLLKHLNKETKGLKYKSYKKEGKKKCYKINVTKNKKERKNLFQEQLKLFTKCIKQVSKITDMKLEGSVSIRVISLIMALKNLLPVMQRVYKMTYDKEIDGKQVPNDEKIFSIYEQHTDIIVKGQRKCEFGHKIDIGTGTSNLILTCFISRGNPNDSVFFRNTIDTLKREYGKAPDSVVADGGYASLKNRTHAVKQNVKNVVFNKITKSIQNIVEKPCIETALKQWRSGIEAVISNLKRGYKLVRCSWKGWAHFQRKVYWSIIAYNIRVMTSHILSQMKT